jgi:glycosyltransferase involved in cell wall biosynthesis
MERIASGIQRRIGDAADRLDALFYHARSRHQNQLVIYDDAFPHPASSFRLAEFHAYLEVFPTSQVHSTGEAIVRIDPNGSLRSALGGYTKRCPRYAERVFRYNRYRCLDTRLVFMIFIYNARSLVERLDHEKIPFVWGLYPGAGFRLNDERSDNMLRRITASPNMQGIITTQRTTYNYLLDNKFSSPELTHFIFGVPTQDFTSVPASSLPRRYWKIDKNVLDVCFVAHKYMPQGRDKGYDIFLDVATRLSKIEPAARFHIVGPYDATDGNVQNLGDRLQFYGTRTGAFFRDFYSGMDLIVSPNAPFILAPGAFDGFPLTCCVEAALCGTAVCCCDELRENQSFIDNQEIIIINRDPKDITELLETYIHNPERLRVVATQGQRKFASVYSWEQQIAPRIRVLERSMAL